MEKRGSARNCSRLVAALALLALRALPAAAENRVLRIELDGRIIEEVTYRQMVNKQLPFPWIKGRRWWK